MAWYDIFQGRETREAAKPDASLSEVVQNYDIIDVNSDRGKAYILVADKADQMFKDKAKIDIGEIGTASPSPFVSFSRGEYNRELQGLKGLEAYDRMRRSDGTTRGTLRMIKTPVLAGRWFIEPASDSTRDRNVADFVWNCLNREMSVSFPQMLTESLLMCDFGYYMFEKVWEERVIDGKERLIWKKLAPRHPMDVMKWNYDKHGGPKSVLVSPPQDEDNVYKSLDPVEIPIDKLLVFTFDREGGNIEGISVLRSAYKHWYYKEQLYKIDAIQKERHGIGVPVIKLPPNYTTADKQAADQLGRNLRTNERAHVVLPPGWELLSAKLEGNPVDAMKSIEHHNSSIRENILASFMDNKSATKEEDQTMFLKSTRFVADIVCETFNTYAIPQLVEANYERVGMPKLRARRIGESADWRTLSFAVRNLIGAGVIRPDDRLESFLRDEMDLPKAEITTVRVVATPQAAPAQPASVPNATPGNTADIPTGNGAGAGVTKQRSAQVGLPRQSPVASVQTPARNAGVDHSGGN